MCLMYNQEKLKEFAEKVREQTEKYNLPTTPKRKKNKKVKNIIEENKSAAN